MKKTSKLKNIIIELAHHAPFSISGVVAAMIFMGVLTAIARMNAGPVVIQKGIGELFHVFHPFHVLVSAVTTTAADINAS